MASAPLGAADEPNDGNRELLANPVALYHHEKARRQERLRLSPPLVAAKKEMAAHLEREKARGRGGRPKGSKPANSVYVGRPGRPRLDLKSDPADALLNALGHFAGGA